MHIVKVMCNLHHIHITRFCTFIIFIYIGCSNQEESQVLWFPISYCVDQIIE